MKKYNRKLLQILTVALVFILLFTGTAAACGVRSAAVDTSAEEIDRGVAWEALNTMCCQVNELLNRVGDDFTDDYHRSLGNHYHYAVQLLESTESSKQELEEMAADLSFMLREQKNPANHARYGCYTVAFTNNGSWSEPIYLYSFNDNGDALADWPGEAMTGGYVNEHGQKQYYAYVPVDYSNTVINSGQLEANEPGYGVPCVCVQTTDIKVTGNTGYYLTGKRDSRGRFTVASWELRAPQYRQYGADTPDPPQPTEAPTVKPTDSPTTAPTEAPSQAPTVKAADPITEEPTEFPIDDYIAPSQGDIGVYWDSRNSEIQNDLYALIEDVDSRLLAPGNHYSDEYIEKLHRIRSFAASVYNHRESADHELLGAMQMLQMAIDGKSYREIVDCMTGWFYMPDEIIYDPVPTTAAPTAAEESTESAPAEPASAPPAPAQSLPGEPDAVHPTAPVPTNNPSPEEPEDAYVVGDADGDGTVTILDATRIQRVLAGLDARYAQTAARRAAINDTELSILDATLIQRWLSGYETLYAIGERTPA